MPSQERAIERKYTTETVYAHTVDERALSAHRSRTRGVGCPEWRVRDTDQPWYHLKHQYPADLVSTSSTGIVQVVSGTITGRQLVCHQCW